MNIFNYITLICSTISIIISIAMLIKNYRIKKAMRRRSEELFKEWKELFKEILKD